jgi:hypothetical protein
MNTLSVLLYVADLISKVEVLMWWSVAISVVILLVTVFHASEAPKCYSHTPVDQWEEALATHLTNKKSLVGYTRKLITVTIILISSVILIPSKETMYLIAASEVGEDVVKSEEVREIKDVLLNVLQSYSKDK